MSEQPPPSSMRSALITQTVEEVLAGMNDMGLTPPEALVAAELLLWQLMKNGFELSPTAEIQKQSKFMASRVLNRLASRVEAWPAQTTERM